MDNPYKFIWEHLKDHVAYWDYMAQKGRANGHEVADAIRNAMEMLEEWNIGTDKEGNK